MARNAFSIAMATVAVTLVSIEVLLPLRVGGWAFISPNGSWSSEGISQMVGSATARAMLIRSISLSTGVAAAVTVLAAAVTLAVLLGLRWRGVLVLLGIPLFTSGAQTALAQSEIVRLIGLPGGVVLFLSLCSYALPFGVIALIVGTRHITRNFIDAAAELAAGRATNLLAILLPMMAPAMITSAVVAFLVTINESTRTFHLSVDPVIATYVEGKMAGDADQLTYAVATVLYAMAATFVAIIAARRPRTI